MMAGQTMTVNGDERMNEAEIRTIEATDCDTCSCWTHICNAECCKGFRTSYNSLVFRNNDRLIFNYDNSDDMRWYYELHGCTCTEHLVTVPLDNARVQADGEYFYISKKCQLLQDNKCKGWPEDRPQVCQAFNERTGEHAGSYITPNCLCQYKTKVVKLNYELFNYVRDNVELKSERVGEQNLWKASLEVKLTIKKVESMDGSVLEEPRKPKIVKFSFIEEWKVGVSVQEQRAKHVLSMLIYNRVECVLREGLYRYGHAVYHVRGVKL